MLESPTKKVGYYKLILSIPHPPGKLKTEEKTRKGNNVENWKVEKLTKQVAGSRSN
jgi:hypothetical protein